MTHIRILLDITGLKGRNSQAENCLIPSNRGHECVYTQKENFDKRYLAISKLKNSRLFC